MNSQVVALRKPKSLPSEVDFGTLDIDVSDKPKHRAKVEAAALAARVALLNGEITALSKTRSGIVDDVKKRREEFEQEMKLKQEELDAIDEALGEAASVQKAAMDFGMVLNGLCHAEATAPRPQTKRTQTKRTQTKRTQTKRTRRTTPAAKAS